MEFRYSRYDRRAERLKQLLARLERLFNHLLLQTDGDVEAALRELGRLGRRYGFFDEEFGLADFKRWLEERRLVRPGPGGAPLLTSRGEQGLRRQSLDAIFSSLERGGVGDHRVADHGQGNERLPETRPYEFGDGLDLLDAHGSLTNALRRSGIGELELTEQDLEVFETEHLSSSATVLLIDVSHSMILYGEDRITPAKQVALALTELIRTRYPKDSLDVVLFGDTAWQVPLDELPYISIGPYHTNTRDGLRLARELLRRKRHPNRQIFMLTDGKPSCLTEEDGRLYKNPFGLDRRVVNKTLEEAAWCRRVGIPVTTFMLTNDPTLVDFVERFTQENRGRAYYSGLDRLGSFVLVDYLTNRKRKVR
jgi:Ca-activated chloride channel family protein